MRVRAVGKMPEELPFFVEQINDGLAPETDLVHEVNPAAFF